MVKIYFTTTLLYICICFWPGRFWSTACQPLPAESIIKLMLSARRCSLIMTHWTKIKVWIAIAFWHRTSLLLLFSNLPKIKYCYGLFFTYDSLNSHKSLRNLHHFIIKSQPPASQMLNFSQLTILSLLFLWTQWILANLNRHTSRSKLTLEN